jgi:hypothetical protein
MSNASTPTLRFVPTYPDPLFSIGERVIKKDLICSSLDADDVLHIKNCSWNTLEEEWMYNIEDTGKFPAKVHEDVRESNLKSNV